MELKKALADIRAILEESQFMDKNAVIYMWQKIKTFVTSITDTKVDKVAGKGLSTHDLTDELLEKINNAGDSSFTGVYADLTGKPTINGFEINGTVTLDQIGAQAKGNYLTAVPDEYVTEPELTGKGYQTASQVESAITSKGYQTASDVSSAITTEIGKITKWEVKVLGAEEELPHTGVPGTFYLKPIAGGSEPNLYDEYIWVTSTSKYEKIEGQAIDLSGYWNETNLKPISNQTLDEILV